MSRTAKVIPFQGDSLVLEADWLHEGQREVYESPARFKVVVCGRQQLIEHTGVDPVPVGRDLNG